MKLKRRTVTIAAIALAMLCLAVTSVAAFQGSVYLAGPSGLNPYSSTGSLEHIYRT